MNGVEIYAPRTERHRRTWTLATPPLIMLFILVGGLITAGLETAVKTLGGNIAKSDSDIFLLTFVFGFSAFVCFLWVWLFERRGLAQIGFNGSGTRRFLLGVLWGLIGIGAVVAIISAAGGYSYEAAGRWTMPSFAVLAPFLAYALAFIVQSSTEEIMMRGWLMQLTASRHGVTVGIVFSTLVFSVFHGANIKPSNELLLGLLNILLVGAFLGLFAVQEGSIWGVCGWHAAWNWLLGAGFGLEVSGGHFGAGALVVDLKSTSTAPWWVTGGAFGPEASVVTTGVLLVGFLWLLFRGRRVT